MYYFDKKWFRADLRKLTRKRSLFVRLAEAVELHGESWDGGSKTGYSLYSLTGRRAMDWPTDRYTPSTGFPSFQSGAFTVAPGEAVIQGGIFRGKPSHLTLIVRPEDAWRLFDSAPELPADVLADWLAERGLDASDLLSAARRFSEVTSE